MSEHRSRRQFLQWLSVSSGALLLGNLGCGSQEPAYRRDAGDPGGEDAGLSKSDAATGGSADAAATRDTSGTPDTGADAAGDAQADAAGDAASPDAGEEVCEPTGSDVEGPFHEPGAPERTVLAGPEEPGERLVIEGRVLDENCRPVSGALLDVWHADVDGAYHGAAQDYRLRGQMMTDGEGRYRFETIMPGRYPLGNSTRPAHIHFIVSKPGFSPLTTQLYFAGDPFLSPNDPCGAGCNSGDPTLIIELREGQGDVRWVGTFDIVLVDS